MTKSAWFTMAVWATGLVALGGLTYALGRPLEPRSPIAVAAEGLATAPLEVVPSAKDVATPPRTVEMPVVEIVGYVSRPARVAAPPPPRELSAMRCSEWRELLQGSPRQRVQLCE